MRQATTFRAGGSSRVTAIILLVTFVIGNVGCPISAPGSLSAIRSAASRSGVAPARTAPETHAASTIGQSSSPMANAGRYAPGKSPRVGSPAPAGEAPTILGLLLTPQPRVATAPVGMPSSVVAAYVRPAPVAEHPNPSPSLETPPPRRSAA